MERQATQLSPRSLESALLFISAILIFYSSLLLFLDHISAIYSNPSGHSRGMCNILKHNCLPSISTVIYTAECSGWCGEQVARVYISTHVY